MHSAIGVKHFVGSYGPVEGFPMGHVIRKDAGLRVEGFEDVPMLEASCGTSVLLDLKIMNHDPGALRLLAGDCANRRRTLRAGF